MELSESHWSLLNLLTWQPWLTPEHMARRVERASSRVLADRKQLRTLGLAQRLNPRGGWMSVRAIFALTGGGVSALAGHIHEDEAVFRQKCGISRARYTMMLWRLKRVWQVRNGMLALDSPKCVVNTIETEMDAPYKGAGKGARFTCTAMV